MVFMPPRSGKSLMCSHYFPAWYLMTRPEHRVVIASYGADYAASWGAKVRDTIMEFGPALFGVSLRSDSLAADHFNLAKHRGGLDTAGVGTSLTGKGADLMIMDDLVRNWEDAQSPIVRQKTWDWYTSTAYTRLSPNGRIVFITTRWHYDDVAGRLLKQMEQGGERWEVLSLPAIAEEHDAMGRLPGEPLWPEQWPLERLQQIKTTLGTQQWISLYQQRPSPESGLTFKREWFTTRYRDLPQLTHTVMAIDSAFKTGVANDYSAIATWGTNGVNYYGINVWRDRVEYPDLKRAIIDQFNRFRPNAILIEDAASGQSVIQDLRRTTSLPIVPVKPKGSKQSRADTVSPLFEAGKVYLPESATWLDDFIDEHITFPNADHDDMVDTTAHALTRLSNRQEAGSIPSVLDMETEIAVANIWDAEPDIAIWS
jgi:predicted phage terminase large subunit-like protein